MGATITSFFFEIAKSVLMLVLHKYGQSQKIDEVFSVSVPNQSKMQ